MNNENNALPDEEIKSATGGYVSLDSREYWYYYKPSGVTLHCPSCMSVNLEYRELADVLEYRCRDCKRRFYDHETGCKVEGKF